MDLIFSLIIFVTVLIIVIYVFAFVMVLLYSILVSLGVLFSSMLAALLVKSVYCALANPKPHASIQWKEDQTSLGIRVRGRWLLAHEMMSILVVSVAGVVTALLVYHTSGLDWMDASSRQHAPGPQTYKLVALLGWFASWPAWFWPPLAWSAHAHVQPNVDTLKKLEQSIQDQRDRRGGLIDHLEDPR